MELNRELSKNELQTYEKHFSKCLTFLATIQMPIKNSLRFHLILVRVAKNRQTNKMMINAGMIGEKGNIYSFLLEMHSGEASMKAIKS